LFKGALIFIVGGIFGTIFGVLIGGALGFFGGAIFWEYNDQKDREKGYKRVSSSVPPRPGATDPTAADAVYKTPNPYRSTAGS